MDNTNQNNLLNLIERIKNKKSLSVFLSKLRNFEKPKVKLEQYRTFPDIAGDLLWSAYMAGDIEGKVIADLGAGTGMLGIGALILGAKKVYFVEKDKDAIETLKKNLFDIEKEYELNYDIFVGDVLEFRKNNKKVDLVIQNPPFGTKTEHADKKFLEKAFDISNKVYSLHKTSTEKFINAIAKDFKVGIVSKKDYSFPIKKEHWFQKSDMKKIEVSLWIFEKKH